MSARTIKLFALLLTFLLPSLSYAAVSINEVFYSPQSKSWIEIYNDTDSSIDLTKYKVLDSGAATNGHAISAVGNNFLEPHQYGVIAKDPATLTTSAALFKSSLGAKTSGDTISLKDDGGNILDIFTFTSSMGAAGDGNSLQKTSGGGWISAPPTPGNVNATTAAAPVVNQDVGSSTAQTTSSSNLTMSTAQQNVTTSISTHYSYLPLSDFASSQHLEVSAGRPRLAAVGNPVEFVADANQDDGTVMYEWSFGDGTTESNKMVRHIYQYPGEYAVVLNAVSPSVKAIARTTIKIVSPDMFVLDANREYVEVHNNSSDEMNLYGWELRSGVYTFMFPKDTILLPGQSVKFANALTRLAPAVYSDVKLAQSVVPGASSTIARMPAAAERQKLLGVTQAQGIKPGLAVVPVKPKPVQKPLGLQVVAPILALSHNATTTATTSEYVAATSSQVKTESTLIRTIRHFFGMK